MLKQLASFSIAVLIATSLVSCESTTAPPSTTPSTTDTNLLIRSTDRAVFVVNEGNYGKLNSSMDVIVYRPDSSKTDTIVYPNVLTKLGNGNDVLINGSNAIVLDAGGSLTIVRIDSLLKVSTIDFGSDAPNKMALIGNDLLLVTRRSSNSAAIVDLSSASIIDSVEIGEPSVAIGVLGNKAYVTSYTATTNHVNVIDLATRKVTKTISIDQNPEGLAVDSTNKQIILKCDGDYVNVPSELYWMSEVTDALTDSVVASPDAVPALIAGRKMFLVDGDKVSELDLVNHRIEDPIISGQEYFYNGGYSASTDELYLGVSDFTSGSGHIEVFDAVSGTYKTSFPTGIVPAHFAFYR